MEKLRFRFLETSKSLLADTGTPKGVPAKPQIEVCNQRFDGIWNPKNLEKHRFGPKLQNRTLVWKGSKVSGVPDHTRSELYGVKVWE